jgi:hypothetical protein
MNHLFVEIPDRDYGFGLITICSICAVEKDNNNEEEVCPDTLD